MLHTILITLLDVVANLAVILVPLIVIEKVSGWRKRNVIKKRN